MSIKDDGGPAFPLFTPAGQYAPRAESGMSLRDWFAGQALAGLIACHTGLEAPPDDGYAAESAYDYADAMLVERAKESA